MRTALWVWVLCVQGYLLTQALDCADGGADCANAQVSRVKVRMARQIGPEHGRGGHHNQAHLPGAFTAKGFPNTLIQADRSRRNLNSTKRRPAPLRSRVGSHSLLSNNLATPLQVVRARGHGGPAADSAMSSLKLMKPRYRRSATRKKKNTKAAVCS
ncbi:uncharacterized protein si:dkey-12l12.1 [Trichomycterus rosablanca]|uniref:uncharacterized protein si:dkey-12l12.1 n=1 Tax=Trichomycterus rosablanca TaxID=2290929 RepID=UPI002F35B974